jgi:glutathione S-transferase
MSEKLTLYFSNESIASQSCLMLIKILKINIELEVLHHSEEEKEACEFKLFNKVPVLVNDDLILTEPRAIMSYLVDLKCNDNAIYPRDLKKRALIDQRMFYDAAVVYPTVIKIIVS